MAKYYAAVDMGASSGRLILGHMENGRMELEEIHRFENGMVKKDGELCWEFMCCPLTCEVPSLWNH